MKKMVLKSIWNKQNDSPSLIKLKFNRSNKKFKTPLLQAGWDSRSIIFKQSTDSLKSISFPRLFGLLT